MPKISIIVPVYNTEEYLDECVQSIVNQTLQDIEIVLVDDGSPDNCPKMCDDWAKKDSRVKVIHKQNGGVSSAVLIGIKSASSDIIGFVDSDDYVKENMFKALVEEMENNHTDFSSCGYIYNINSAQLTKDFEYDKIFDKACIEQEILTRYFKDGRCINNLVISRWNKVYKKSLLLHESLLKNGYELNIGEDVVLNLLYLNLCNKASIITNNCNYNYRINNSSATHCFSSKIVEDHITLYDCVYHIAKLQKRDISGIAIQSDYSFSTILWQSIESKASLKDCICVVKECYNHINDKNYIVEHFKDFPRHSKIAFSLIAAGKIKTGTFIIFSINRSITAVTKILKRLKGG